MYQDFTSTPIFNKPMLRYPPTGSLAALQIPLHITEYKTPLREMKVNTINTLPRIGGGNVGYKSSLLQFGGMELPVITLQGWIQTPCTADGNNFNIPALTYIEGGVTTNVTYVERMVAYMEGRAVNTTPWTKTDPDWFLDPYGRVYTSPRVIALTGTFIEGVPGRTNFSLTLQV